MTPPPTAAPAVPQFDNYIDGRHVASSAGRTFDDVNPHNAREVVARF